MKKLSTISEACEILGLIDKKTKKPLNHVLRYWEKEFKQIKPTIINRRRYYSFNDIKTIQNIKFYLKDQKMTIAGVKLILNANRKKLDEHKRVVYRDNYKYFLKDKSNKLLKKIKSLKKYGKKNSS